VRSRNALFGVEMRLSGGVDMVMDTERIFETKVMIEATKWTEVEKAFINRSGKQASYKDERVPVVEVLNVYELGKIVALSFLEWVHENPTGVVALPTGKTPEYFIKTLEKYKNNWSNSKVREEVQSYGFKHDEFPRTDNLRFVMLDEFFPMLPTHRNSFCNYVNHFYISLLGIKEENVLNFDLLKNGVITLEEMALFDQCDVDLTLLTRDATTNIEQAHKSVLHKVEKFCEDYENKIASLGGIGKYKNSFPSHLYRIGILIHIYNSLGFFLGGIGPDGHIAFNQPGSDHKSLTR
jgi:glucosamine-6-phosphate deaminase